MLLLGSTIPALAARIDIDDPALLGPVLFSIDVNNSGFMGYEHLITEVRYAAGAYSYIYAVQTTPYFPSGWGASEGEPTLLSVAVTGHPLGGTWGAIYSSSSIWGGFGSPTNIVESITPILDGFIAIPERKGAGSFTVVYWQSPLPPAFDGTLTYTASSHCYSYPRCFNEDGSIRPDVGSFDRNVFAPVPEPGSIFLLGAGLTALALRRRRRSLPETVSENDVDMEWDTRRRCRGVTNPRGHCCVVERLLAQCRVTASVFNLKMVGCAP